jgi:hypothetical protein
MNIDSTMEAIAVVTPKLAIASRSHITSHTKLQKPETTKKIKYHRIVDTVITWGCESV